ncbi:MAG TPA: thiolase family protein, partial [bacterium]|nr:thiolase family protein [bacterium]
VYVSGAGMTRFGRREESLLDLFVDAGRQALEDSGFDRVDQIYVGSMSTEEMTGEGNIASVVTERLNLLPAAAVRIETASSTGAAAISEAFLSISSGYHKRVMVIAGEKMTHLKTDRISHILAEVIAPQERAYGLTMPALAALVSRYYMWKYNISRRTVSMIAVKNHFNASLNPHAHFQKEITAETVEESKIISSPLTLYDCAPISDGACALVLTAEKGKVRITGIGQGTDYLALENRDSLTSFRATRVAVENAYRMSGRSPADVEIAEIHDAFTPFELVGCEDTRLFLPGQAAEALLDGTTAISGRLPVNPSGGLKARGHPVGASGLAQIVELVWQMKGKAGKRQVQKAGVALAQSIGGLATNNFVTILEAK